MTHMVICTYTSCTIDEHFVTKMIPVVFCTYKQVVRLMNEYTPDFETRRQPRFSFPTLKKLFAGIDFTWLVQDECLGRGDESILLLGGFGEGTRTSVLPVLSTIKTNIRTLQEKLCLSHLNPRSSLKLLYVCSLYKILERSQTSRCLIARILVVECCN